MFLVPKNACKGERPSPFEPPPSVYARNRALGGKRVTAARRVADPSMVMAINRVGVNLNQMVRAINSGAGYAPAVLTETLERINSLLDRLQE